MQKMGLRSASAVAKPARPLLYLQWDFSSHPQGINDVNTHPLFAVMKQVPNFPETLAYPSAARTATASWRVSMSRTPINSQPIRKASRCPPWRPKTSVTPSVCRHCARRSPPVNSRVSGSLSWKPGIFVWISYGGSRDNTKVCMFNVGCIEHWMRRSALDGDALGRKARHLQLSHRRVILPRNDCNSWVPFQQSEVKESSKTHTASGYEPYASKQRRHPSSFGIVFTKKVNYPVCAL